MRHTLAESQLPDYQSWAERDLWTLPEAVFLVCAHEPLANFRASDLETLEPRDQARQIAHVYRLAKDATIVGNLGVAANPTGRFIHLRVMPRVFVAWAKDRGLVIPPELEALIAGGPPPRPAIRAESLKDAASTSAAGLTRDPAENRPLLDYCFHRNPTGTWAFRFEGRNYPPLPAQKGFRYLQHLLQNAGKEIPAIELSALVEHTQTASDAVGQCLEEGLSISSLSDAGPVLDDTARRAYQNRLEALREQREEAEELGDDKRIAQIEAEEDLIAQELKRATGLRGRDVVAASPAKRAQQSVSSAIRRAITTFERHCPELGAHLRASVKTGNRLVYRPKRPINWCF